MSAELGTLVWVLALQLIMWVPYILNVVMVTRPRRRRWLSG